MMNLTFAAWKDGHYVSLAELLEAFGDAIASYRWTIRIEEVAPHPKSTTFEKAAGNENLTTERLREIAAWDVQIIDGEIVGHAPAENAPVVILRAVDSTSWDVSATDDRVIRAIKSAYPDAQPFDTDPE
jgi:hypothetical protein